jgi:type I restriction enzyme S subunit
MKNGWEVQRLGDIAATFADGDWVESKDQAPDGIRLIQTGNVGEGVFKDRQEKARYISESTFKRLRCTEIFEDDVLISRLPDPVGRSCILPDVGERMITAVDCTIVRFDKKRVLPDFFNFYSQSNDYINAVENETSGTTRKRISRSKLGLIPVPVPPLPEQKRIVGILDEAFEGIATAKVNAEKNLQNARALFENNLQNIFSRRGPEYVEKLFSEVCKITSMLVDPRQKEYLDLLHVGGANIETKTGKLIELKNAREEKLISGKFLFDENMVLYSKIRPYLMKVARPTFKGLCSADIYPLSVMPSELDQNYLYHLLLSPEFTEYAIEGSARAGMPKVNREHLFAYTSWFPPLKEQRRLAKTLDALFEETQKLESVYKQKHDALEDLEKSLLNQAFTGQL